MKLYFIRKLFLNDFFYSTSYLKQKINFAVEIHAK